MTVTVNGDAKDLHDGTTLPDLLADLGLGLGWVVVERNGEALTRVVARETTLADGDVLEIVRAVAGG
ncbi:MAG: sulfur carrier protein [Frankiaceae bacterium]|jgi:sulfur carrier protein|nr:sulfur carrier protein [Frankiaceae bacterium]MDQ1727633.1 sulfur carrier protein [Frankiaceae bacterium]